MYNQSNIGVGAQTCPPIMMSAPQHIGVGAPTGRISGVWEQTSDPCRLPSKLASVGEPTGPGPGATGRLSGVGEHRADVSAPQQIAVGEPTGRFLSVPQQIGVG